MAVLERVPDHGRVVIAHPGNRLFAAICAEREGLDLILDDLCPRTSVYVMDVDAIPEPTWRP
jgi:hypothetical protein